MSEVRVSDPSRLHLKKELTQIRKAAKVLRDPGTTSSWKSPLNSSKSAVAVLEVSCSASARKQLEEEEEGEELIDNGIENVLLKNGTHLESRFRAGGNRTSGASVKNGKEKRVFLYNWKAASSEKSSAVRDDVDEDEYESRSMQESIDDDLSDGRNVGDVKIESYLGNSHSASMNFRCRDADLVSPVKKRGNGIRKKGKKASTHLDVLSRYQQKEMNLRRLLKSHHSVGIGLGKDESLDQSNDTEEFSNSDDLRKVSGTSPLLQFRQKNWSHSTSKLLKSVCREDSSYSYSTPALSTSSFNKYYDHNQSTVGSWDATTTSLIDDGDDDNGQLDLPGRQGCGIPCYWSRRTPRHRDACGSCCSPFSDTLRRKGSGMICGSQSLRHRCIYSSSTSCKHKIASKSAKGLLPLLSNGGEGRRGSSLGTGYSDDELSTNFGEIDLEALSRLDGRRWSNCRRRWSNCRSQDASEIVALNREGEHHGTPENIRSLSQKYKPFIFDELIGQSIVVQSLINAISRGRIAPVYLFQGPRGTGKTSTAGIFASALNCLSTDDMKPCGHCRECINLISGNARYIWEIDGTNKKGIDSIRHLLKNVLKGSPSGKSRYNVFIIDECHLLPSRMWLTFLKFFEEPKQQVIFIFITTDLDNVPHNVQSRCQKYFFNKIRDGDIVARLGKIATEENLDVDLDALELIALNADGSLRDAETMLDQLSLLGKRITTSLVNELLGVVADEKLLELLELALSSDTAETVKQARDLLDSGIDPLVLMSQMASLIMDIIAGTYSNFYAKYAVSFVGGRSLTQAELERLKHALKLLSEAEKQLRVSNDRSTWFTATLLQLSSVPLLEVSQSSSSRRQSSRSTEEDHSSTSREAVLYRHKSDTQYFSQKSSSPASLHAVVTEKLSHSKLPCNQASISHTSSASRDDEMVAKVLTHNNLDEFNDIWEKCIARCHSKTLRQLLHCHGKLLSIFKVKGSFIAYVAFEDEQIKARAERFLSSITNSLEMVLRHNVEVRIIYRTDGEHSVCHASQTELPEGHKQTLEDKLQEDAVDYSKSIKLLDGSSKSATVSGLLSNGNNDEKDNMEQIPVQRIESIIREQRLETAWLQAAEKGTPRSLNLLKPEKNQVLPEEDVLSENQIDTKGPAGLTSQHWEDELNHEIKVSNLQEQRVYKDRSAKQNDLHPPSPSLLHITSSVGNANKETLGYESSSASGGCNGFLCWSTIKPCNGKAKRTTVHPYRRKHERFVLFGKCRKHIKETRAKVTYKLEEL